MSLHKIYLQSLPRKVKVLILRSRLQDTEQKSNCKQHLSKQSISFKVVKEMGKNQICTKEFRQGRGSWFEKTSGRFSL